MSADYDISALSGRLTKITAAEIFHFWEKFLWKDRKTAIEGMSQMTLLGGYSTRISDPLYYGVVDADKIVGVNSIHRIDDTIRSRGLWVDPQYRNLGYGLLLTSAAIKLAAGQQTWSFPRKEALPTYTRAGFLKCSDFIFDELENKHNCYVVSQQLSSSTAQ
jgi:GNAT superfamily N-acetyltransferase